MKAGKKTRRQERRHENKKRNITIRKMMERQERRHEGRKVDKKAGKKSFR